VSLLIPVRDSAASQIIGRHFNANAIADQDANAILTHLARDGRQHHVLGVIELNLEECVGLLVDDSALRWNQIISGQ
jgi:hypothetical protein